MRGVSDYYLDDLERKMMDRIEEVRTEVTAVSNNVASLTNVVAAANSTNYAEIQNNLDNSHPEFSTAAYTTLGVLPSDVTDANRECYNWYRQLSSAVDLEKNTANALKGAGHSTFAANETANEDIPRWDVPNGQIEIGGVTQNYDLLYQIPNDLIFPGQVYRVQFEAQLRTATAPPANLQFFAAFYDNTTGQKKIIEGGNFAITGEIFGDQSGVNTVEYQVVAYTDSGEEAVSNILSLTNAPATFTQNNHPRINFRGAPGFIRFDIYRRRGSEYVLQFTVQNSIEGTYFDVGNAPVRVVPAFPSLTATPPRAYAKTRTFAPGAIGVGGFVRHSLTIAVPTTYNSSLTAPGQQWLRLGLTAATTDPRQIIIRRIGLSLGDGTWARSANDLREGVHSTRTSTAVSSGSGNGGTGVPSPSPSGSGNCVLMTTDVDIINAQDKEETITLRELQKRCLNETLYCNGHSMTAGRVMRVKSAYVSRVFRIKTEDGEIVCTPDHPFILSRLDVMGTPAARLKVGMRLRYYDFHSKIISIDEEFGDFEVGIPELDGTHICILNGFVSHNSKANPEYPEVF